MRSLSVKAAVFCVQVPLVEVSPLEKRHFFLFKRPLRAQQKRRDRCRLVCFVAMVAMEQSTPTTPSAHRREPNTTPRLRRRAKPRHPGHPAARAPSRSKFSTWRRLEVSVIGPTFISLATSHGLPCHFRCAMFHWPGCVFTAGGWT